MGNEKSNYETYKELMGKYKFKIGRPNEINMDDYDVVVSCDKVGYAHVKYKVLKNVPNLTDREIALLCDGGRDNCTSSNMSTCSFIFSLKPLLAETPPANIISLTPYSLAARIVLSTKTSTTTF